ncbi:MAG TPA: hypothetical protein EYQ00_05240 [Dehalococcoidia bacterium]|nr:hypothetical protein [Dehalococcoidia bacterium]
MTVTYENSRVVLPGDVIVDRAGNEMIVIEILNSATGDCYVLYNGDVKLVNAFKSSKIIQKNEPRKISHAEPE